MLAPAIVRKSNDGQLAMKLASHVSMDPTQDSQVPLLRRHRSKKSLESLQSAPSKAVLPTPASYVKAVPPSKEEELAQLMAQIALLEGCDEEKEHTRHDAMLLMMGFMQGRIMENHGYHGGYSEFSLKLLCLLIFSRE